MQVTIEGRDVFIFLWLLVCAVFDLRRREVPDWLTLPAVAAGLLWRALHPDGWLAWALAGVTIVLTLINVLPGGDMKGLAALALIDPRLYLAAWLGAGGVYLVWRLVRRERWIPGYVGFLVGVAGFVLTSG
jgi:prepilin peptidase CpaA